MTTTTIDKRWLNPYEVRTMRRLRREGEKVLTIAWALDRDRNVVSAVLNGRTYTNVPDEVPTPHPWDLKSAVDIYHHRQEAKRSSPRKKGRKSREVRLRAGL